jgi:4-hydroxybenzoate polyprenyltransferase
VRRTLKRIITAIQLTRLTMAFGAVSDVWFIILLTRAWGQGGGWGWSEYSDLPVVQMSLPIALLAGAIVAVGLFAYGASLNDLLDIRHDTTFSPDRPLPAGRIKPGQATVVTVGALIVAMLAAESFGTAALWIAVLTAAALLFYNATGKFIPGVGVITIGLVHAAHMLVPNSLLAFMLPVWLVMTHAVVIAAMVHVFEEKRPMFSGREIAATTAGWMFWSGVILTVGAYRMGESGYAGLWPKDVHPIGLFLPLLAAAAFVLTAWWKTRRAQGRVAAEKMKRYGAMWQCLYGASWLLALGLHVQAMWLGAFAVAGFTAMTLIKELTGLTAQPVSYRA